MLIYFPIGYVSISNSFYIPVFYIKLFPLLFNNYLKSCYYSINLINNQILYKNILYNIIVSINMFYIYYTILYFAEVSYFHSPKDEKNEMLHTNMWLNYVSTLSLLTK